MNAIQADILQETKRAFDGIRRSVLVAMGLLWKVKEEGHWESVASSWGEYVESELGISQGFASKLISVHKHYLTDGGVSQRNLEGVDIEKLYAARSLSGTPEEQVEKARVLSRRELKEERNDEKPHEHEPITICRVCAVRL